MKMSIRAKNVIDEAKYRMSGMVIWIVDLDGRLLFSQMHGFLAGPEIE